ncbi:MAG: hypothetical protein AAF318_14825 [Pseudomonadota bacterium]
MAASAGQADTPRWFSEGGSGDVHAKWGIPQTDAVGFEVMCEDGGSVVIRPALYAMDAPDSAPDIRFEVDGEGFVRDATLDFSERDAAWHAKAVVSKEDALIGALRRGNRVSYDFEPPLRDGDRFSLDLTGSAKAIDAMLDAC